MMDVCLGKLKDGGDSYSKVLHIQERAELIVCRHLRKHAVMFLVTAIDAPRPLVFMGSCRFSRIFCVYDKGAKPNER